MSDDIDSVTGTIIEVAIEIHRDLGPGLLESVYETVLAKLLTQRGLAVERQKSVSFSYQGIEFSDGFRCDLLVDGRVVVELKSTEKDHPVYAKQLLTYLRLMNLEVGLLLNFGASAMRDGLKRVVNHHAPGVASRLRVNQGTEQE